MVVGGSLWCWAWWVVVCAGQSVNQAVGQAVSQPATRSFVKPHLYKNARLSICIASTSPLPSRCVSHAISISIERPDVLGFDRSIQQRLSSARTHAARCGLVCWARRPATDGRRHTHMHESSGGYEADATTCVRLFAKIGDGKRFGTAATMAGPHRTRSRKENKQ